MEKWILDLINRYCEEFGYVPIVESDDRVVIRTSYGDVAVFFKNNQLQVGSTPIDKSNEEHVASLVKIRKHFAGRLRTTNEERKQQDTEVIDEKPKEPVPEKDNLGRPYLEQSDKPPKHFTEEPPEKKKKSVGKKLTPEPAPAVEKPVPGTKTFEDAERAKKQVPKPSLDDIMDGKVEKKPEPPKPEPRNPPKQEPVKVESTELKIEDAAREMAFIKILMSSPAGAGKTLGALLVGRGLCDNWSEICLIDTEHRSGSLYVNTKVEDTEIGKYKTIVLDAPYTVERYLKAMEMAEKAGIKVLIIDSLTHAWSAEGGLLDLHTKVTAASKTGNSYTAWKDVTPLHAKLIEKILTCSMHVILTVRSKTEYVMEQTGKGMVPKKVGMGVVFRDGLEYETSITFEIDQASHTAYVSKDRTRVFEAMPYIKLGVSDGKKIRDWLEAEAK